MSTGNWCNFWTGCIPCTGAWMFVIILVLPYILLLYFYVVKGFNTKITKKVTKKGYIRGRTLYGINWQTVITVWIKGKRLSHIDTRQPLFLSVDFANFLQNICNCLKINLPLSEWSDSNWRPLAPHASTLANCATPRSLKGAKVRILLFKNQSFWIFFSKWRLILYAFVYRTHSLT